MDIKYFSRTHGNDSDLARPPHGVTAIGFALCREDRTLFSANQTLRDLSAAWGGVHTWWQAVCEKITLPAATQCPSCGLAQMVGTVECILELAATKRYFLISLSGHVHDVLDTEQSDVLLVHETTSYTHAVENLQETIHHFENLWPCHI